MVVIAKDAHVDRTLEIVLDAYRWRDAARAVDKLKSETLHNSKDIYPGKHARRSVVSSRKDRGRRCGQGAGGFARKDSSSDNLDLDRRSYAIASRYLADGNTRQQPPSPDRAAHIQPQVSRFDCHGRRHAFRYRLAREEKRHGVRRPL